MEKVILGHLQALGVMYYGITERVAHSGKGLTFPSPRLAMSGKGHSGYWSPLSVLMISLGLKTGLVGW